MFTLHDNLAAALCAMAVASLTLADTVRVPADFASIQAAIDDPDTIAGDVVLVAPGTYHEWVDLRGKAITLISEAGADQTIIDSTGLMYSTVRCAGGESPDTIIDGFTLTGGEFIYGGGFHIAAHSSPTIRNCIVTDCFSTGDGGGLYIVGNSMPLIEDCAFIDNQTTFLGGGAHIQLSAPTIRNCVFENNESLNGFGGGISTAGSQPIIENTIVRNNIAPRHGGGLANFNSQPTYINCDVTGNAASTLPGKEVFGGGGIYNSGSTPEIIDCLFMNNSAPIGGGMFSTNDSEAHLTMTTFCSNIVEQIAGGFADDGGNVILDDCRLSRPGDINGDNAVDGVDLLLLLNAWGTMDAVADLTNDGIVSGSDLLVLLNNWG